MSKYAQVSKAGWEVQTCSRCGGCGEYSFNMIDGTRCYGCGGSGLKLTKRGAEAKAFYQRSLESIVKDVQVGDYVFEYVNVKGARKWLKVSSIKKDELNVGQGRVTLELCTGGKVVCNFGTFYESKILKVSSESQRQDKLNAALAYQDTLTVAGKPRKKLQSIAA